MKIAPQVEPHLRPQKDPRFLYLRIMDLSVAPYTLKGQRVIVKMQLSNKYSQAIFNVESFKKPHKVERIHNEAHIFKYGGQEFLNISLQEKLDKDRKEKKDKNEHKTWTTSGYCRILLPPLIQYPHICHTVNAQLIRVINKAEFMAKPMADLKIEIYYRLNFQATIDIIPVSATLVRNIASVGQMRPIIQLQVQDKKWQSLQAGGIHPCWSGHYHAKRLKKKENSQFMEIVNIRQNIEMNEEEKKQRNLYHSQNLKTNQGYFDIVRFHLKSAGCYLRVKIYAFPTVGKTPVVTGLAQIRMSNFGFFKYPQPELSNSFVSKQIDLYLKQDDEPKYAGNLTLDIRFIFDKNAVLNQGPFIEAMPISKTEQEANQEREKKRKDRLGPIL